MSPTNHELAALSHKIVLLHEEWEKACEDRFAAARAYDGSPEADLALGAARDREAKAWRAYSEAGE